MISKIRTYSAEIPPAVLKNAAKREAAAKSAENKKIAAAKAENTPKAEKHNINIFDTLDSGDDDNDEMYTKTKKNHLFVKNISAGIENLGKKTAYNFSAVNSGIVVNCLLKLFINAAVWFFVFMLLLAAVIYAAAQTPQKTFLGYSCYAIADECFEPNYSAGECIITGRINAAEIEVNDFITFIDDDEYIAGIVDSTIDRYKNVNAKFFRVKDAYNNTYVVEPKDITGKEVCRLSGWGYIVNLLGSGTLYN